MKKELVDIIDEYELLKENYRLYTRKCEFNKDTLIEYQSKFVDLKALIRPWKTFFMEAYTKRDDKSCSAIKYRIAISISNGEYVDKKTGKQVYEKCSITSAEKYANGNKEYQEFINQRSQYKSGLTNTSCLIDDINSYIMEIRDRLK